VGLQEREVIRLDKEDWKLAMKIMLGLGLFCVAVGIFGMCYFEVHRSWLGLTWRSYPYYEQGVCLLILGIAVLIVAACLNERVKTAHARVPLPVPP